MDCDNVSKLVIFSGNARIVFDGAYGIVTQPVEGMKKGYKLITFNESGQLDDKPNKKYVTFAPHYFPGTLITARILIKHNNTKQ